MKSRGSVRTMRALLLVLVFLIPGCVDTERPVADEAGGAAPVDSWHRPLPEPFDNLRSLALTPGIDRAAGIWLHEDHAYVAGQGAGVLVVDLRDPAEPQVVGQTADISARDVALMPQGDRLIVVAAGSGQGMHFVDVTDPASPVHLSSILGPPTVHNVAVVPGTSIAYNSRSVDTPGIDVVDASDPTAPRHVRTFGDVTCHDVTFHMDSQRAFCPGIRETQIWDISDPADPQVVTRIVNPAISIHHWALPAHNGSLLIIGDEFGGSTDAAAGCFINEPGPQGTLSDPLGAVWFYDLSGEGPPMPISYVSAAYPTDHVPPTPCTAHFGEVVPGQDLLLVGWRAAGVYLIDFADLSAPETVAKVPSPGDVWEARFHGGYVFAGDSERGFEVYEPV